jgi:hypothetical protein
MVLERRKRGDRAARAFSTLDHNLEGNSIGEFLLPGRIDLEKGVKSAVREVSKVCQGDLTRRDQYDGFWRELEAERLPRELDGRCVD